MMKETYRRLLFDAEPLFYILAVGNSTLTDGIRVLGTSGALRK